MVVEQIFPKLTVLEPFRSNCFQIIDLNGSCVVVVSVVC